MDKADIKDGKNLAIISYLTFIGLIIAVIINLEKRNPFAMFHIRQMCGLLLLLVFSNLVEKHVSSLLGTIFWAITFSGWVIALVTAIRGEDKPLPVFGEKFQTWFKNIK